MRLIILIIVIVCCLFSMHALSAMMNVTSNVPKVPSASHTTQHFKPNPKYVDDDYQTLENNYKILPGCRKFNDLCISKLSINKSKMKRYLKDLGAPVAKSAFIDRKLLEVRDYAAIKHKISKLEYPVVIKPINDAQANGVRTGLRDTDEVIAAFRSVKPSHFLVEEQIEGTVYRLLYVNKKLLSIAGRDIPYVIGDGTSTITELIGTYNSNLKGKTQQNPIEINETYLKSQGYDPNSVPIKGTVIKVDNILNFSRGAITYPVLVSSMHPDNAELFDRILSVYDSNCLGIDYVSPDISKSYKKSRTAILEFNSDPARRLHDLFDDTFEERYMTEIDNMKKLEKGRYKK